MAEQIISPGVFTRENDLSFLPQGVGAIGAAIVGPTVKGPAFVPTVVRSFAEYERRFGGLSKETFVPQTVREYLRNAGSVTVCRVLAGGGYTFTDNVNEPVAIIGGNETVAATMATSSIQINGIPNNIITADGNPDAIEITPVGENQTTISFVFIPNASNFADTATVKYVDFDTTKANAATNLKTQINNAFDDIVATTDTTGDHPLVIISGSAFGSQGNHKIASASGDKQGGDGTFSISEAASTGNLGGSDGVADNQTLLGLIYPSKAVGAAPSLHDSEFLSPVTPSVTQSFNLTLAGSNISTDDSVRNIEASVNPNDSDGYLFSILGDTPNNSKTSVIEYNGTPGYSYLNFKSIQKNIQSIGTLEGVGLGSGSILKIAKINSSISFSGGSNYGSEGYSYASTPFIKSQLSDNKELFRFHSIGFLLQV